MTVWDDAILPFFQAARQDVAIFGKNVDGNIIHTQLKHFTSPLLACRGTRTAQGLLTPQKFPRAIIAISGNSA